MQVIYKFGCMNSGKSLELIKIAYNYQENNIKTLILKPQLDNRSANKIFSRCGLSLDAIEINENDPQDVLNQLQKTTAQVILIEECNFLAPQVVDLIIDYGYEHNFKTIIFFGIKTDFRGELFAGSKRIIERCDKMEESTSLCWCGKKARQNGRVVNNKLTKQGETFVVDNQENDVYYVSLCNYHFYKNDIGPLDEIN